MKPISLSILITLLALIACKQVSQPDKHNSISKVTIGVSSFGCEVPCPSQAFSIDKDLTTAYYSTKLTDRHGYFKGTISAITWDSIQTRFNKFILEGIDTTIGMKTDHPEIEVIINVDGLNHKVGFKGNSGKIKNEDLGALYWFSKIVKKSSLERTDTLAFETTMQYYHIPYKKAQIKR